MNDLPILSMVTFAPLAGALLIAVLRMLPGGGGRGAQAIALFATVATFLLSLVALGRFDADASGYQLVEDAPWFMGTTYRMGVDGLALSLVLLTTFLTPLCILSSFGSVKERVAEYMIAFLILETLMIGVFCALDLVLFYIFFEGGLIPMFIIIGVWGGKNRLYAAFKFFLYTLLGSLFLLAALVYMYLETGVTDIAALQEYIFDPDVQTWLWLAFFASFAVKLPMWPVHTWLPDAHVEAPTGGSVILAGVLLKMGGYGFLRFSLPMFPDASELFQPMMLALGVVAIIYTSLVAFRQTDIKKLIAYSSVAHMGFVTLGIFSLNEAGIQGAIFQMLSHGVISGALFFCVGVIYDRMHTREIAFYGGLVHRMPVYAALFMLFSMANVGLPGTSGFVGEIMTMIGGFQASSWAAAGAAVGVILSAVYMLTLYRRTVFGELTNEKLLDIKDVGAVEFVVLGALGALTLILGVFPSLIFDLTERSTLDVLRLIGR
ncbi:NADH-quinone oxidoreductase subunit M [bacterium]|nr:NADH-quinone oxidoreductase subunit M [bacterium]